MIRSPARFSALRNQRVAKAAELGGTAWSVPRPKKQGGGFFVAAKGIAAITNQI